KCASRRGRAAVINRPINNLARFSLCGAGTLARDSVRNCISRMRENVFGGNYVAVVCRRNAGAINSRAESGSSNLVNPCINVGLLLGQHAASLLLIEENDGCPRKAFAPRGCRGSPRVRLPEASRV